MFGAEEPKILSVSGDVIRDAIRSYLERIDQVVATYRQAQADKLAGRDWEKDIETMVGFRRAAEWALPVVADGPHLMTFTQWVTLRNNWGDLRNAAELVEWERNRQAAIAGAQQRSATGQPPIA